MSIRKCAHQSCMCTDNEVRKDGFCSDSCKQGHEQNAHCACGHLDCQKAQER